MSDLTAAPRPERTSPRPLAELAALLSLPAPAGAVTVTGATHASGQARPGDLYVALPGARTHGARYAAAAVEAGAVAVLTDPAGAKLLADGVPALVVDDPRAVMGVAADWAYHEPTADLTVLGVTGTSGKTTTAYLLDAGLVAAGRTTGLVGTVETRIAGQRVKSPLTTPEATDLHAAFALMRERGVTDVSMEVSSHALALGRVGGVRFRTGAFTNLSQDHLDFHPDMEDYFRTKAQLFDGRCAYEVVCTDGEWGRRLVKADTITVAGAEAAWRAVDVQPAPGGGTSFTVLGPDGLRLPASVRLPGAYNVANALLAVAVLQTAGVAPDTAVRALAEVQVPGRMERVDAGQPYLAVVDYAHKPAAVAAALAALRPLTKGRLIVVLGCGGDRDRGKRPVMGAAAGEAADLVVVTDDNPRSEDPAAIRAAMVAGLAGTSADWREVGDRGEAIRAAVAEAAPGDTVLIAGKGHEQGQEVHGRLLPFDDRAELRAAIEAGS